MKHIEPSKFHPTFSLPSPQWHTLLLPLFKYERTAFGFSTHYSSFLPDCLLLALCFHLLFFLYDGDFEPRGECTLAKYIDSTLSVYAIESLSVVVVATLQIYIKRVSRWKCEACLLDKETEIFVLPFTFI